MLRTLLGYAVLAVIGYFALRLVFALLGVAVALVVNLLWLAALGVAIYLVLKLIAPDVARRVHQAISGTKPPEA